MATQRSKISFRAASRLILACIIFGAGCKPFFFAGPVSFGQRNHLEEAEELSRRGEYDKAVEAYLKHIDYRLSLEKRPAWENPYLYLLLIGDLRLQQGKVDQALSSYEEAEKQQVDLPLVSDRYRYVASWYEKQGKLDEAFEVLTRYRDRDPLLMDAVRDRIARAKVEREDTGAEALPVEQPAEDSPTP